MKRIALRGVSVTAIAARYYALRWLQVACMAYGWGFGRDETLGLGLRSDQLAPLQYPTTRLRVLEVQGGLS